MYRVRSVLMDENFASNEVNHLIPVSEKKPARAPLGYYTARVAVSPSPD